MQCALVLQYPQTAELLCKELAKKYANEKIDVVVGPALGGVVVSQEMGRALGVRALFTERKDGVMSLRRGFVINPGEKVLVVEDVTTTGGSVREVIEVVKKYNAKIVGVAALSR